MKTDQNIEKIQELLESKSFDVLTKTERQLVLKELSEVEYRNQYQTILAATAMFAKVDAVEPKPLVLGGTKHFLAAPIPLYQALIGIAAMAVLMLLVFPIQNITLGEESVKYLTVYDTVEVESVRYDTVERIIEKPVVKEKIVYLNSVSNSISEQEAPRLFEVPRTTHDVSFAGETIENKGTSMKEERVSVILPKIY